MLAILKDAATRPTLFVWFGPIAIHEIDSWLKQSNLRVPDDVRELWAVTGGGDCFESETIFRPTAVPCSEPYFIDDFVDSVNQYRRTSGMPRDYLVFHEGCFTSAIRLSDQKIVTLDDARGVTGVFLDLDDWYVKTLRDLFANKYGLPTG